MVLLIIIVIIFIIVWSVRDKPSEKHYPPPPQPHTPTPKENSKERTVKARILSIKLGVAVAMSDENFHSSEAEVIKEWIKTRIPSNSEERKKLKGRYNYALKTSFNQAKNNNLNFNKLLSDLRSLNNSKYEEELLELCYKIMAADNVIDSRETDIIDVIKTNTYHIDKKIIEYFEKTYLVSRKINIDNALLESINIDPNNPDADIKEQLTDEFQKWNNRLTSVPFNKRNEIQVRLDKIALARIAYP
jgi:hypothetical protein